MKYLLLGLLIGFAYDVGFGVEATIVAIALLIVSCIIVYLWGSKNIITLKDVHTGELEWIYKENVDVA